MENRAPFYDRESELGYLKDKFEKLRTGELIVVYGRRRLGKTRLLEQFLDQTPKAQRLYFYVNLVEERELQTLFQADIKNQSGEDVLIRTWADFFNYLGNKATNERKLAVVLDEFQRFKSIAPGFITQLQNHWDSGLKNGPLLLILVGSSVGMMKRITASGAGPLYGRKTGQINLKPFAYGDFRQVFPTLSEEKKIEWYSIFGGTPLYLELSQKHSDVWNAVEEEVLNAHGGLREEPKNMLEFELRAIARYNSILHSIASGKQTIKEISDVTGIKAQSLPVYLKTLQDNLNLVRQVQPVFGKRNLGRYRLDDPFFSFWYRFVAPQSSQLELGQVKTALSFIQENVSAHAGIIFENVIRELFTRYNGQTLDTLGLNFDQIGPWWNKQGEEIDLVVPNKNSLVLVEVKWKNKPTDAPVLENLIRKSSLVPRGGLRRYVLVSKSGFTPACTRAAQDAHALLLTLDDVERLYDRIAVLPLMPTPPVA